MAAIALCNPNVSYLYSRLCYYNDGEVVKKNIVEHGSKLVMY